MHRRLPGTRRSAGPSRAAPRRLVLGLLALSFSAFPAEGQVGKEEHAELLPGPDAAEFAGRRAALGEALPGDGVFVAFGTPEPAADYMPYQQDPSFRYLTGLTEPSLALVMVREGGRVEQTLFVRTRDPSREIWEGARLGVEGAGAATGIPARSFLDLPQVLDSLMGRHGTVFTLGPVASASAARPGENLGFGQQMLGRLAASHSGVQFRGVEGQLSRIRAKKSPAELDLIRRSVYISAQAHREAMKLVEPGMNEFEVRAAVEYTFLRNGAEGPAYASIVGSGGNSTTLHYRAADRFMEDGEVLLFDVGSQYRGYAADITRTVPVNGRYSPEQRAIYEIVLEAQKAAEALFAPGITWREMNQAANAVLAEGLTRLGLIDAPDATYDCGPDRSCAQMRLWYMHGLGHGVGMAVHDPDLSAFGGFEPGTAISIEPGIYVRSDALDFLPDTPGNRAFLQRVGPVHQRYSDIGVRIEDIFILDDRGVERVSAAAPREIDEIEALMRESSGPGTRSPGMVDWYRDTGFARPGGR
jgi:Xaa-Pro aminopeptidase